MWQRFHTYDIKKSSYNQQYEDNQEQLLFVDEKPLVTKEMQIKTIMSYYFTHRKMAKSKKTSEPHVSNQDFDVSVGWSIKPPKHLAELLGSFLNSWTCIYNTAQKY